MNQKKIQKIRRTVMYLWFLVMPITFNWMSPVLIVFAGFDAIINLSYIFFGLWFLSSLIFGRAYCSWICQWGAIQELFYYTIPQKLGLRKEAGRLVKYFVFIVWMVFVIIGPIVAGGFSNGFSPYYPNADGGSIMSFSEQFNGGHIFYFGIQLILAVMFGLIFGGRSFCSYGCPMAVLGIIGTKIKNALKYPSLHLESVKKSCIKCGKCTKSCPMSLEVKEMVQKNDLCHNDCILCGSCIEICPKNTIQYKWKWKKSN